jgi:hypothetical protein
LLPIKASRAADGAKPGGKGARLKQFPATKGWSGLVLARGIIGNEHQQRCWMITLTTVTVPVAVVAKLTLGNI